MSISSFRTTILAGMNLDHVLSTSWEAHPACRSTNTSLEVAGSCFSFYFACAIILHVRYRPVQALIIVTTGGGPPEAVNTVQSPPH